jgi:hypothetical protein
MQIGKKQKNGQSMQPHAKSRLLLLITNSFAAMNVIHSGLIKQLAENYEVYLLSPLVSGEKLLEISKHFDIELKKVELDIPPESRRVRMLRKIQKAFFFRHFEIATQHIKNKASNSFYQSIVDIVMSIAVYLGLTKVAVLFLRRCIIRIATYSTYFQKLKEYQFKGIISSSPLDIRENMIVNFLNIPSVAMVISWDNLTSKGIINANYDCVLVWNQFMADEYCRFYSMSETPAQKVCITGIPRFDIYFRDQHDENSDAKFRKEFQIGANQKIVLFATSASKHFRDQSLLVDDLNAFTKAYQNVIVIVKCHPGDHPGYYAAYIKEKNLRIWPAADTPISEPIPFSKWFPEMNFLHTLSQMLRHCDVCINIASTMTLDASACNKPVISIAYDGNRQQAYPKSVRRFYDYSHQILLEGRRIDCKVYSREELFSKLDQLLNHPPVESQIKKVLPFIHHSTPNAVESTMFFIKEWLN